MRAGPLLNPALSPAIAPNTSATHAKDRAATPGELVLEATRNLEKMKQTIRIKVYIIIIIILLQYIKQNNKLQKENARTIKMGAKVRYSKVVTLLVPKPCTFHQRATTQGKNVELPELTH